MKKIAGSPDLEPHPSIPVHWKRILEDFADEFGYYHLSNKFKELEDCQQALEVRHKDHIA